MGALSVSIGSKIPLEFHRPPDSHPCRDLGSHEVPVVDLSSTNSRNEALRSLRDACENWGFFQLLGHGIPTELMDQMVQVSYELFDLPAKDKLVYHSDSVMDDFGFMTSFEASKRRAVGATWQEFFVQKCIPPCDPAKMPPDPALYREVSTRYGARMKDLAQQLLDLFSESLGLGAGDLRENFEGEELSMRLNHYPPCPEPHLTVGIQPHSDINAFTILYQDAEGLEVLHNGAWVCLKPLPGALVINVGDQLQILSNDTFKSVEHRGVVNAERARVSIACFYGPSLHARIKPVPELVSEECPAKYRESVYGEYAKTSLSTDLERKNALSTLRIAV